MNLSATLKIYAAAGSAASMYAPSKDMGSGEWRTINGIHVFIKEGESPKDAFARTLKEKTGKTAAPSSKASPAKEPKPSVPTKALKAGQSTEEAWKNPTTREWDPERAKYHQQVVDELLEGKHKVAGRQPVVTLLGGGTASGKTTASRKIMGEDPNVLRVDPDEIKLAIPEYAGLKKSDPMHAAALVHEESSYITKMAMAQAGAKGLDIVYDSTTAGNGGVAMAKLLSDKGYNVSSMFMDVPISMAKARAAKREGNSTDPMNFGRHVPDDVIEKSHYGAADKFMALKDMPEVSQKRFYDNTGAEPRLIYERDGMGEEKIHDQDRWKAYQNKAAGREISGSKEPFVLGRSTSKPFTFKRGRGRAAKNVGQRRKEAELR